MGTRRSCLGVAVLHGLLYAAGGYDGASCLNRYTQTDILVVNAVDIFKLDVHCYILLQLFLFVTMLFSRPCLQGRLSQQGSLAVSLY